MPKGSHIPLLTMLLIILLMPVTELSAQTFSNPISDLADPHITFYNNYYYLTGTTGSNITIRKAATLNALKFAPGIVVFTPPSGGPCCNFWAPELHRIDNKWYVYYTAGNTPDVNSQRTWVIENASSDPVTGTWTNKGQIYHPTENFWAIDGSVFQLQNKNYFIWSGHSDASNTVQRIYIAEMSSPWTLTGSRVMLSSPEYAWERNGDINEGPIVLQRNGKVFLVYSASACWTDDYALGMLTMNEPEDPLKPSSWIKSDKPLFTTNASVMAYGPGHNGFFLSPDGTEFWNTYHATTVEAGACDHTRTTRAQILEWNADGTPDFGSPVKTGEEFSAPAGEIEQPASDLFENGTYKFVSKASNKVLNIVACSPALGADVVQGGWVGKECQQWNIQATGDGYFVITALRGGLALDVAGCSNDNYANVQTWAPNGAYCQQWKIEEVDNGYYRLLARNSNKALTVVTSSPDEGANVVQQEWTGADGQQWRIEVPEEVVTSAEQNVASDFFVFPNPAKNMLSISEKSSRKIIADVTLTDLLSREIYRETWRSEGDSWLLNTSNFPAGLYFLRIRESKEEFTMKVIIEK